MARVPERAAVPGFDRLSLQTLGSVLTIGSDPTGEGVLLVKRGSEYVFDERNYRRLFPSRSKVARRFERIYLGYRIFRLLNWWGYKDAKIYRKQRHGFWNTLWLVHIAMTDIPRLGTRTSVAHIKSTFDAFEGTGRAGRIARARMRRATIAVWKAWRNARRADPEAWTANNFFKSKFGNRQIRTLAYASIRRDLKPLALQLVHK